MFPKLLKTNQKGGFALELQQWKVHFFIIQGWRKFMEDTSIAIMNLNNNPDLDLFAIFDGHGGNKIII